ncbi:MAG TPA: hypothetical protein EYM29_02805 [Rhodospirillales bacterium]|jgi:hypothetical protein|nr:MAG: hypothetical protein CFH02_01840 [Alphaproteobacteria bacterium MarineAlpha3_Bin1]HIM24530.1 hypothetical protein [Rhodospirillales bacterium]HIM77954.1 hypothetical protein [Rhodospirillales bacterium]
MQQPMSHYLYYGLWIVVLIIALCIEVMPVFLILVVFSFAFGAPNGAALIIVLIAVICMVFGAFLIATKLTRRITVRVAAGRRPGGQPKSRFALSGNPASPSEYYRDLKRLG